MSASPCRTIPLRGRVAAGGDERLRRDDVKRNGSTLFYMIEQKASTSSLLQAHSRCRTPSLDLKLERVRRRPRRLFGGGAVERHRFNTGEADGRRLWTSLKRSVAYAVVDGVEDDATIQHERAVKF